MLCGCVVLCEGVVLGRDYRVARQMQLCNEIVFDNALALVMNTARLEISFEKARYKIVPVLM